MLHRLKITSEQDTLFVPCWALYVNAFPEEERRTKEYHLETITKESFYFEAILDEEKLIGILCWWNFSDFRYIEHFATLPELRGAGYGKSALEQFITESEIRVILEVEHPNNSLNERRISFYERLGFVLSNHPYSHPPYTNSKNDEFLNLLIMCYPKVATPFEIELFKEKYFPLIHYRYF